MTIFTIRLEDQPGTLAVLAESISRRGIDIRAVGGGGIGASGIVSVATDNDVITREALRADGFEFIESEAILADVEDKPGSLAKTTRALADAGVNIQAVLVMRSSGGMARLAIAVGDPAKAKLVLGSSVVAAGA